MLWRCTAPNTASTAVSVNSEQCERPTDLGWERRGWWYHGRGVVPQFLCRLWSRGLFDSPRLVAWTRRCCIHHNLWFRRGSHHRFVIGWTTYNRYRRWRRRRGWCRPGRWGSNSGSRWRHRRCPECTRAWQRLPRGNSSGRGISPLHHRRWLR